MKRECVKGTFPLENISISISKEQSDTNIYYIHFQKKIAIVNDFNFKAFKLHSLCIRFENFKRLNYGE